MSTRIRTGIPEYDAIIDREIRYGQTRWAEIWMACIMVGIGAVLLADGNTFSGRGFAVIAAYVTEDHAGWIALIIGTARLIALWINGRHSRSPIIRTLGCAGGFLFYSALALGIFLTAPPLSTGIAVYGVLAVAELHSSSRAASDAFAQDSLGTRQRRRERDRHAAVG